MTPLGVVGGRVNPMKTSLHRKTVISLFAGLGIAALGALTARPGRAVPSPMPGPSPLPPPPSPFRFTPIQLPPDQAAQIKQLQTQVNNLNANVKSLSDSLNALSKNYAGHAHYYEYIDYNVQPHQQYNNITGPTVNNPPAPPTFL